MAAKQELAGRAHCLLFPISWDEPFGMVMIEAMACGTPVVALNRGSVPEVVADGVTGYVRDDPADLAAIDSAGGIDPAACRRHVEQHFDAPIMAAGYERVYAAAVSGSSPKNPGSLRSGEEPHAAARDHGASDKSAAER